MANKIENGPVVASTSVSIGDVVVISNPLLKTYGMRALVQKHMNCMSVRVAFGQYPWCVTVSRKNIVHVNQWDSQNSCILPESPTAMFPFLLFETNRDQPTTGRPDLAGCFTQCWVASDISAAVDHFKTITNDFSLFSRYYIMSYTGCLYQVSTCIKLTRIDIHDTPDYTLN